MHFPTAFIELLTASVGPERAQTALEALEGPPSVSVRLNPAKLTECPFPEARNVPWSPWGYLLKDRPVFTLDPLYHAGCYYVQDTSAMFVGHLFRFATESLQEGAAVLDLCAAPGGKTTDLAASLRERFGDRFTLIANEVIRSRYGILRSNVETWGDPRVGTVSRDPSAFGQAPLFHAMVADVPCSGEGMFRKDAGALADWSPENVQHCAARARRILRDSWPALAPGGILLYSTCTFNTVENDETVDWIKAELGAEVIVDEDLAPAVKTRNGYLLLPGLVPGEGQYAAALRKKGSPEDRPMGNPIALLKAEQPVQPDPGYPHVEVDRETALRYLHGDAVVLPGHAPAGLVTLCFQGQPLGPGKNLGKRCNNLYPKAKRIRMDIR